MKKIYIGIMLLMVCSIHAQISNQAIMDTSHVQYKGKVTVGAYIDSYYAYDFNKPDGENIPYFVSMARHNEMTINLAFIDLKYSSSRLRARFVPGFGTYINANYAKEPGALKNIVEASAGIKLFKSKSIWLDFGVFGSPYTNESAISKDHLAYTRSFAPEYVPYYLSGVKFSAVLTKKLNAYVYLVNGWQQIADGNSSKSIGTQLEYRPNNKWLLNWNTYIGKENSIAEPNYSTRYFSDFYFIYSRGKWSATGCVYIGLQKREQSKDATWWQANLIGQYAIAKKLSATVRAEYFSDSKAVLAKPITIAPGFNSYSSSFGLNGKPAENVLLRLEYRIFYSTKDVYERSGTAVNSSNLITSNVTIWF